MSTIFFYGLFMDADLLAEMGLYPTLIGPAELPDFQIRIGDRATLISSPGSTSYGVLMKLTNAEALSLYSRPGVRDYAPEPVDAILLSDRSVQPSLCYNLPPERLGAEVNVAYAEKLADLVLQIGLPSVYSDEIRQQRDA